jgi:hypothetical protein
MKQESFDLGVIVERRKLKSRWDDFAWFPVGVLNGNPDTAPWTVLDSQPDVTRFYAGSVALQFFSSDTATYRENLDSGAPKLWIVLAPTEVGPGVALQMVTADPAEGEAMTESGFSLVEAIPMPAEIQERLTAFVAAHHVERGFFKRKRDRADTETLASRAGGRRTPENSG